MGEVSKTIAQSLKSTDPSPTAESPNSFNKERQENAAKREQKGQNGAVMNGSTGLGRGQASGMRGNKQVRFAEVPFGDRVDSTKNAGFSTENTPDPDHSTSKVSPFGTPAVTSINPFAPKHGAPVNPFAPSNPFGAPSQTPNTAQPSAFGQPPAVSNTNSRSSPFGAPSQPSSQLSKATPFGTPSQALNTPQTSTFGQPSNAPNALNPFSTPFRPSLQPSSASPFGAPADFRGVKPSTGSFGQPSFSPAPSPNPFGSVAPAVSNSIFGSPSDKILIPSITVAQASGEGNPSVFPAFGASTGNGFGAAKVPEFLAHKVPSTTPANSFKFGTNAPSTHTPARGLTSDKQHQTNSATDQSALAMEISQVIQKKRLVAPAWPNITPARQNEYNAAIDTYWRTSRDYRAKVRQSLIDAGLLDDPEKAKKLSEAIDFKGICQEMCPIFERATRINESDVKQAEMTLGADGNMYVAPEKMVKANARSAAGQDAPLPMDVRSPSTLRRTLNYMFNEVLGKNVENLYNVHNFLWDRTRAIRRDFVFQSSMDVVEMSHQTYCLERIVRFHAISLHQMSKFGISTPPGEDFSEQQEVEQLSKALLSLMHCYDDCNKQKFHCENEPEFRAYYVLFNCRHPGVLQNVQAWGYELYDKSDEIQTAVAIVESLQNIWNMNGPLTPHSTTDVAQNAYAKFFTIIQTRGVSYTMACFAEMHFNSVRKVILKTILASYRKQRDQTKDWSLTKLNVLLKFDHEDEIVGFGEAYGLSFEEVDGKIVLLFGSDDMRDPFPPLKQAHSFGLVERKRGHYTLPEAISLNVYDESAVEEPRRIYNDVEEEEEEESLFVRDDTVKPASMELFKENFVTDRTPVIKNVLPETTLSKAPEPPSPTTTQLTTPPFPPATAEAVDTNVLPETTHLTVPASPITFQFTTPPLPRETAEVTDRIFSPETTHLIVPALPTTPPLSPRIAEVIERNVSPPDTTHSNLPSLYDRESQYKQLTNWLCFGEDGLIEQFVEFSVEGILKDAEKQFRREEKKRIAKENAESMRAEADAFRYRSIATRYFQRWRDAAQHLRLKRRGREARKARQERAENLRASKAAESTQLIADFNASTASRRRGSLESLLDATGVLDGVHDPETQIQTIVQEGSPKTGNKRQRSHKPADSTNLSTSSNCHKRGKSDNPLRRSLLLDPSYLAGGSRIHLMSSYSEDQGHRQISGVQTDYFRLKARGISTLHDGTPLASSVARSIIHRKRSFDGISKHPTTPQHSKRSSTARSVPAKTGSSVQRPRSSVERDDDIHQLKLRAQALLAGNGNHQPKRSHEEDDKEDEALFERAKRIREKLDEGSLWYRAEIAKHSGSRSVS
jgi:hypothetical protein